MKCKKCDEECSEIQNRKVVGSLDEGELLSNDEDKISKKNIPLDENGMPVFKNTMG